MVAFHFDYLRSMYGTLSKLKMVFFLSIVSSLSWSSPLLGIIYIVYTNNYYYINIDIHSQIYIVIGYQTQIGPVERSS